MINDLMNNPLCSVRFLEPELQWSDTRVDAGEDLSRDLSYTRRRSRYDNDFALHLFAQSDPFRRRKRAIWQPKEESLPLECVPPSNPPG